MAIDDRVPLQSLGVTFTAENVAVRLHHRPRVGRVVAELIMDETILGTVAARALEAAVEQLGSYVAYEHEADVKRAVNRYLLDGTWVQPIVEQELRRAVRELVLTLWSDDEKKAMRDWFDLFTQKCRGEQL